MLDQQDSDLLDECVAIYTQGARTAGKIARIITQADLEDPAAQPSPEFIEKVQRLKDSGEFLRRVLWVRENKEKHVRQEVLRHSPTLLRDALWLASDKNPDKRTRTANIQFLLAAGAGLSPTQKHELSGSEDLVSMCREIFGKPKQAEPPAEEPTKAEGTE